MLFSCFFSLVSASSSGSLALSLVRFIRSKRRALSLALVLSRTMPAALLAQQRASSGLSASISGDAVRPGPRKSTPTPPSSTARFEPARSSRRIDSTVAQSSSTGSSAGTSGKGFRRAAKQNAAPISITVDEADDDAAAAAAAAPSTATATPNFNEGAFRRVPRPPPPPPPPSQPLVSTVTTIDRRVYDQVAASRTRLASSLSSANAQVRTLKRAAEDRDRALARASQALAAATRELSESSEDAEAAAAAAAHAVSAADRSKKATLLARRLRLAAERAAATSREVDAFVPRRVPLVYSGIAIDVRLVGSFDSWGEGVRLSAVDAQRDEGVGAPGSGGDGDGEGSSSPFGSSSSDSGGTRFEGVAWLLPGRHLVKFVVDGDQYRLAPEWPTATDEGGTNTNNILIVE